MKENLGLFMYVGTSVEKSIENFLQMEKEKDFSVKFFTF